MLYAQIDPIPVPWASTHGLFVVKRHQDTEVRSLEIVDDAGGCYQLWLGIPQEDGSVSVSVAQRADSTRKARTETFTASIVNLRETLDRAYRAAEAWMHDEGHTRTPVL
jgi:hypothetical protein